jgi:long-chain fatty acid transport protein
MSLLLLWSPIAGAAGYFASDVGARGMAQGGAFIAGADDLTALYYNPAALGNLEGPQLMFDFAAVHQAVHFDREDEASLVFDEVSNIAPPMLIPTVGVAHDFNTERLVAGFGFYSPYAPDVKYVEDGAQRYTLTDATLLSGSVGPSLAFRVHEWVTLGAGVAWSFLYVSQDLTATASIDGGTDEALFDIRTSFALSDFLAVTGNMGAVIGPPSERWDVALAVQLPTRFSATGELSLDFTDNAYYTGELGIGQVIKSRIVTDEVTLDLTLPLIVRAGFVFRPSDRVEVELATVYERWRSIQELRITDVNLVIETVDGEDVVMTEDIVIPAAYQDAFSVRLGGNFAVNDRVKLRAGTFFESSAVPEKALGVGLVDGNKFGYGLGISWRLKPKLSLDAAWGQSFLVPIETRSSTVAQVAVDPLTNSIGSGKFVAHGTYRSRFDLAVVGVTWSFGGNKSDPAQNATD